MQASRVKLGGEYAVHHSGQLARFVVTSQTTVRTREGVTNCFGGVVHFDDKDDKPHVEAKFKVDDMLDDYTRYTELVANKQAEQDRKAQAERERIAKRRKAADLINGLLGFEAINWELIDSQPRYSSPEYKKKQDYERTLVVTADFRGIQIDEKAFDTVIAKLDNQYGENVVELKQEGA